MTKCEWDSFTGVECKKEATCILHDERNGKKLGVCQEHFNEFAKDHKDGR